MFNLFKKRNIELEQVENQIISLYALTRGYMDDVATNKISEFESGLISYANSNAKTFLKEIKESKMWTEKGEEELKKTIVEFKGIFEK